jgi:RNA polymerase sigma-70 factor (ECF subfamily)
LPDVTALLRAWSGGDQSALDKLIPLVHGEIQTLGQRYMRQERRRILVDHARPHAYQKWGGNLRKVTSDEAFCIAPEPETELRFFGGLSVDDTAEVLKVSPDTVKRDWRLAKVWLFAELTDGARDGA